MFRTRTGFLCEVSVAATGSRARFHLRPAPCVRLRYAAKWPDPAIASVPLPLTVHTGLIEHVPAALVFHLDNPEIRIPRALALQIVLQIGVGTLVQHFP